MGEKSGNLLESRIASETLKWPRRMLGLTLATLFASISVFTVFYMSSGNREYLLAVVVLAATIPLDVALIIGLVYSNARKIAGYATRLLRNISYEGGAVKGLSCGVILALKVQGGHIHIIICNNRVEVARIMLPVVNPVSTIIRFPKLGKRSTLGLTLTRCRRGFEEGEWSIVSIDPDKGSRAIIYGSIRYSYKICSHLIESTDIEEVIGMVLG